MQDILVTLKPAEAPGPDGNSPHVLKLTAKTISKPLTNLFNLSLQHGNKQMSSQYLKKAIRAPLIITAPFPYQVL